MLGTGYTFRTDIEALRNAYKLQVDQLDAEVAAKRARGMSDAEIRPWAGALRTGRYLRYGGKVLVPLGIAASAYAVYEAPKGEKLKTAGVEGASWAGGAIASEGVGAALLVLAPETGGLSLLGIALIAGVGGGMFSGWGAHKLLFSNHPHAQSSVEQNGMLPAHMVQTLMPPPPAGPHR